MNTAGNTVHAIDPSIDLSQALFIGDSGNNRVRQVTPGGVISTVAGTAAAGYSGDGGPATSANLNGPYGVAVDASGTLVIADSGNSRVRAVGAAVPDRVGPGSQLAAGESITSAQYSLVMHGDGNLVEYGNGRPLWSSGTAGVSGAYLVVQSDGNVVVYSGSGAAVWSTGTWGRSQSSLVMQGDGNLVEYDSTRGAVWASWTYVAGSFVVEQSDGNAVVYAPSGKPVWASNTVGSNASLDMQNDGNLVAYYGNSAQLIN